jgi:hypothetical protein
MISITVLFITLIFVVSWFDRKIKVVKHSQLVFTFYGPYQKPYCFKKWRSKRMEKKMKIKPLKLRYIPK